MPYVDSFYGHSKQARKQVSDSAMLFYVGWSKEGLNNNMLLENRHEGSEGKGQCITLGKNVL